MGLVKLDIYPRETTGKNENRRTRAAGFVPAVLYGADRESKSVQINTVDFTRIMQLSGGRALIFDLHLEGEDEQPIALMREVQQHPWRDTYMHVDLYEIPRGVPVEVQVGLHHEGEPEAVKFGEGEVIQLLDSLTVRCLPREMPDGITADVSALEIGGSIYVKDLVTPAGEIVNDPETQVLVLKTISVFEEVEEEEVVAEGEEGAEGAEGADGEKSEGDGDADEDGKK